MNSRLVKNLLSVLISLFLVYLLAINIDIKRVLEVVFNFNKEFIIAFFVLFFIVLNLRAYIWKNLLANISKDLSFRHLIAGEGVGFAINSFLPLRLGDLIRGIYLSKTSNLPFPSVLVSIATEQLLDFFTILTLGLFCLCIGVKISINILFLPIVMTIIFLILFFLSIFIRKKFKHFKIRFPNFWLLVHPFLDLTKSSIFKRVYLANILCLLLISLGILLLYFNLVGKILLIESLISTFFVNIGLLSFGIWMASKKYGIDFDDATGIFFIYQITIIFVSLLTFILITFYDLILTLKTKKIFVILKNLKS
ncbi:hypothetical protein Thena_1631 [Thermodesulfobium narugense DSM 14796]|uniref:Uncharacterized protein n=1 Tax=Thermodesulfobium narugense DSM 14796 TaxID=747365 RepID=M1E7E6_9BACT|nr:lysylphosphatidylglycerol synthase transmembrane domain-containing protein [Thermodesulfobium narugense]AEE15241.1 hypothetical protein Thena_1631 [Thermodesulfobium narugense DSM 14796]